MKIKYISTHLRFHKADIVFRYYIIVQGIFISKNVFLIVMYYFIIRNIKIIDILKCNNNMESNFKYIFIQ